MLLSTVQTTALTLHSFRVARPLAASDVSIPAALAPQRSCCLDFVKMQEADSITSTLPAQADIFDEFLSTDESTGERKKISFAEKEKLYLECLDAFYNGDKPLLNDEQYEQLKLDLEFEGSTVATFNSKEIKFLVAAKRYQMGTPILSDDEYDKLRASLKKAGSKVVLHEAPTCRVDTGVCKMDMRVDNGKQRLLYFPGTTAGLILFCEVCFWVLHIDPLLSIALGAIPAYFFGVWFTENIFAQSPLVTQSACPSCNFLLSIYFGDLFKVQTDGIVSAPTPPKSEIDLVCPNCKIPLKANRETMVLATLPKVVSAL